MAGRAANVSKKRQRGRLILEAKGERQGSYIIGLKIISIEW